MTELTTETTAPKIEASPAHSSSGRGRISLPSEDEIRGLFITEYHERDPRCAILVRQIFECHRAKNNSSERKKIVDAIKVAKEWRRIAPTWEKFVHRALSRRAFGGSFATRNAPECAAEPVPVKTDGVRESVVRPEGDAASKSDESTEVALGDIDLDCAIRVREKFNQEIVDKYAELIIEGVTLPPIKVFRVNGVLKVTDGQHRCRAAKKAGRETIKAIIVEGSEQEALMDALGANAQHGLPRSNKDKRRVAILGIENFGHLSDREIAKICAVSNTFIGVIKAELSAVDSSRPRMGKDGKMRRHPKRKTNSEERPEEADVPDSSRPASASDREDGEEASTSDATVPQMTPDTESSKRETEDAEDASDAAAEIPGQSEESPVDIICHWLIPKLETKVASLTVEQREELAVRLVAYADDHLCPKPQPN
jgi:hypothetical protein